MIKILANKGAMRIAGYVGGIFIYSKYSYITCSDFFENFMTELLCNGLAGIFGAVVTLHISDNLFDSIKPILPIGIGAIILNSWYNLYTNNNKLHDN